MILVTSGSAIKENKSWRINRLRNSVQNNQRPYSSGKAIQCSRRCLVIYLSILTMNNQNLLLNNQSQSLGTSSKMFWFLTFSRYFYRMSLPIFIKTLRIPIHKFTALYGIHWIHLKQLEHSYYLNFQLLGECHCWWTSESPRAQCSQVLRSTSVDSKRLESIKIFRV